MSDTIVGPYYVIVSPRSGASSTFGTVVPSGQTPVERVVVTGGKRWVPYGDKSSSNYDAPARVEVHLRGQAPRSFSGDAAHFLQVFGGRRKVVFPTVVRKRVAVRGDDEAEYLAGIDMLAELVGADYGKDRAVVKRVQSFITSLPPVNSHADFRALAAALKKDPSAWGSFGPVTKRAVETFNKMYGWGQGPVIDDGTLEVINSRQSLLAPGATSLAIPVDDLATAALASPFSPAPTLASPFSPAPTLAPAPAPTLAPAPAPAPATAPAPASPILAPYAEAKVDPGPVLWDDGTPVRAGTEVFLKTGERGFVASVYAGRVRLEFPTATTKAIDMPVTADGFGPTNRLSSQWRTPPASGGGGTPTAEKSFLLREYGGAPVWAWGVGGVSAAGVLALLLKMILGRRGAAVPA